MHNKFEKISIGISLADAELENYFYVKNSNQLMVRIKTQDLKSVEFIFFECIYFIDRGGNFIMEFCMGNSTTELFEQAIHKIYDKVPAEISYKLFQFLDIGNEPYLEIGCKYFEFKLS